MSLSLLLASPVFILLLRWTCLLALAWLAHWVLRGFHARWRLILWRSVLCFGLLLPLLQVLHLPAIEIPIPAPVTAFTDSTSLLSTPTMAPDWRGIDSASRGATPGPLRFPCLSISWKSLITFVWMLGCALGFVRLIRLSLQLSRLRHASGVAGPGIDRLASRIQRRFDVHRRFEVRISDSVASPFVCGLVRPAVILPRALTELLSPDEMAALLCHEIAHLRRHDLAWCVLWQWMKALCWFHPMVWSIPAAHNLACDQEADQLAARHLDDAESYARMLARLALRILALPALETTLAMNGSSQIALRLSFLGRTGAVAWNWRNSVSAFALAASLFMMTAGYGFVEAPSTSSAIQRASSIPGQAYHFPRDHGVYLVNRGVFTALKSDPVNVAADAAILVFEPWINQPGTDISGFRIGSYEDAWKTARAPRIPAIARRVENHPDMVMLIPTRPLEHGLYEVIAGPIDRDFAVETTDLVAYWESMVRSHPGSWQGHNHLGTALYTHGHVSESEPEFAEAVRLNPQNAESRSNYALALSYRGETEEAVRQLEKAARLNDDPAMDQESFARVKNTEVAVKRMLDSAIDTNLANAYEQERRYDDAIRAYNHALALNPDNASAHCNLGYALMKTGKAPEALRQFTVAGTLDPAMKPSWVDMARSLQVGGDGTYSSTPLQTGTYPL